MESLHRLKRPGAAQQKFNSADTDTVVLLVRHGHTAAVGQRLAGRLPGFPLTDVGREQAGRLAASLASWPIVAIYASPLARAVETAEPLARRFGLPVRTCEDLAEVDFGEWTGLSFAELDTRADWRRFNERRASAPVPGGESARVVQQRVVRGLTHLRSCHAGQTVVAVSHADVIRAAVLYAAGLPLDVYHRYEIPPASVSVLRVSDRRMQVAGVDVLDHASAP